MSLRPVLVFSGHVEDQPPLQPYQNTISQVHPQVRTAARRQKQTIHYFLCD